ncbi:MAG: tetratricopeptide repeat protein [Gammaproteobacteria bacterium]|nr:tetratricopeptide repeat protein [Gammaproteobacteria bacterium]
MKFLLKSIPLLLTVCAYPAVFAEQKVTLADIEDTQDLSYLENIPAASKRGNAIFEYRKYLQVSKQGSKQRRQVLVRLAELELALSEKLLAEEIPGPDDQQLDLNQSIASSIHLFETALKEYMNEKDNDRVLYQLARAYEVNAMPDQLSKTLVRLVNKFKSSPYFIESQFRLAEAYFINKSYSKSYRAYTAVLSQQTEFYDNALYKRGWASFKLSKYQAALKDFVDVLEKYKFGSDRKLSRIENELYSDSLRVISLSFAYLKGVKSVNRFFAKRKPGPYIKDIYYGLGQHYLKQKRYADTAASYMAYVKRYKNTKEAPELALETIVVWQKSRFPKRVLKARENFARNFSLKSEFWTVNKLTDFPDVHKALERNTRLLAGYHHSLGQKKKSVVEKKKATFWYSEYIRSFPKAKRTPHMHFLYAELLSELNKHSHAFRAYDAAAYQYGKVKDSSEAAYAAVLIATQMAKAAKNKTKSRLQWQSTVVKTTLKFAENFPKDKRLKNTLLHVAEIQYEQGKMLDAIEMAEKVLPKSNRKQKKKALLILAHAQFELELYSEAEKNYLRLLKLTGKKHKEYKKIRKRIAISIYKAGELLLKSGNSKLAVATFLRLKKVVPGSLIVATAEYDAATELMKNKQWKKAVPILKRFRKSYPKHKFQNEVTTKLAVAYTETKQFAKAAAEYAVMMRFIKGKEKRRVAYYQIAAFYEKAGKRWKAIESYQKYLTKYPLPFDIAMETRQKMVDIYGKLKKSKKQTEWRNKIISADKKAGKRRTDRSRYLAAMASLKLADRIYQKYTWVKLKAPFKKNLGIKKKRMKKAVTAFANVAKYKIAESTTQATYKIGQVYNNFSKSLMKSERPKKLNEEELEQYEILLEEQAFPFEEKAIEFYLINLNRTQEKIYDKWVRKSVQRLGELFPGRYLRKEKLEVVIDAP